MRNGRALLICLGVAALGLPLMLVAAEATSESSKSTATANTVVRPFVIEPISTEEPSALDRLDSSFGKAVEWMAKILFRRIGRTERVYVEFAENQYYVRDLGSSGPFVQLAADGSETTESLTKENVELDAALGRFEEGADGKPWRFGKIEDREIEFLTVKVNHDKYVDVDGTFHKAEPVRQLVSPDDTLTAEQLAEAAAAGRLVVDKDRFENQESDSYLLREEVGGAPLVVLWLGCGAVFFTIYMRGYNIWGFRHAIAIVRGKYDNPDEPGEVTHFQALASALSATVGLGNIAGVTIAMTLGGPGAFFWMMACGVFGMTSKFVESTLGQKYRQVKLDGTVLGGPMQYLHHGLRELGLGPLGFVLSIIFAVMCILASFGGGNMFQANQSTQQVLTLVQQSDREEVTSLNKQIREAAADRDYDHVAELKASRTETEERMDSFANVFKPAFGVVLAVLVGAVIIGGIKRIGAAAEKVVPTMCLIYLMACVFVIMNHLGEVPALVGLIFTEAFRPEAFGGGFMGVLVLGVQRAAFSNEAGVGSAAIAHSAAKTEEPVREGTVALLGPFIDTIVVCSMTALVVLITGAWDNREWIVDQGLAGAPLTSQAFESEISWFPLVLGVAVVLFAYSTLISWSYYGERCWERLFGPRSTIVYKFIYVVAVFVGAIVNLGAVLDFSDMMILSMAFPNIFGLLLLSPRVRRDLADYWARYKRGEFQEYK